MNKDEAFEALTEHWKKRKILGNINALLHWDMEVNMPEKAIGNRAESNALIGMESYREQTSPKIAEALEVLKTPEFYPSLTSNERRMIDLYAHETLKMKLIPPDLFETFIRLTSRAQKSWEKAKTASDFSIFESDLTELMSLIRAISRIQKDHFQFEEMMDALIDDHERGMRAEDIRRIISAIRPPLVDLVRGISLRIEKDPSPNLSMKSDEQITLCRKVVTACGFDWKAGRMDFYSHPFTTNLGTGDVRFTIRVNETDFSESFYSALHECGHALYEQNLPANYAYTPICEAASTAIHESKARLWENVIGRSEEFWNYFYPIYREVVDPDNRLAPEAIYRAVNRVQPSFIRTEADEVTYNLHIVLRFELEDDLLNGRLEVRDLPAAWNEKMRQYLGIVPPNDALGVLQDIHWSFGGFGYFPSYMLGNIYSAQFFRQMNAEIPDIKERTRRGEFSAILDWLNRKIHSAGALKDPMALCEQVTGERLNPAYYLEYLKGKYTKLYA